MIRLGSGAERPLARAMNCPRVPFSSHSVYTQPLTTKTAPWGTGFSSGSSRILNIFTACIAAWSACHCRLHNYFTSYGRTSHTSQGGKCMYMGVCTNL